MIHTVKGFSVVNEVEGDVFLEFSCFFCDPVEVDNLISGSSVFSKSSLYIWKFSVHILLKPSLRDFEFYFSSMWNECNCRLVWTFFLLPFFGIGMKTDLFQSCGHCWVSQICWHIECSTLTLDDRTLILKDDTLSVSSFRILNSSTRILSPPLTLQ